MGIKVLNLELESVFQRWDLLNGGIVAGGSLVT